MRIPLPPAGVVAVIPGHGGAAQQGRRDVAALDLVVFSGIVRQPEQGVRPEGSAVARSAELRNQLVVVIVGVLRVAESDLFQVIRATCRFPAFPGLLQSRQQHCRQNCDDGDNHDNIYLYKQIFEM